MRTQPTTHDWRRRLTLAAVAGLVSGAAKAITVWVLDHLT